MAEYFFTGLIIGVFLTAYMGFIIYMIYLEKQKEKKIAELLEDRYKGSGAYYLNLRKLKSNL